MYSNLILARFVFGLTYTEVVEVKFKAQYVICAIHENFKYIMFHTSTTVQSSYSRLIMALKSIIKLDAWSSDITQAYL